MVEIEWKSETFNKAVKVRQLQGRDRMEERDIQQSRQGKMEERAPGKTVEIEWKSETFNKAVNVRQLHGRDRMEVRDIQQSRQGKIAPG